MLASLRDSVERKSKIQTSSMDNYRFEDIEILLRQQRNNIFCSWVMDAL